MSKPSANQLKALAQQRYNTAQPRDENGRWTASGATRLKQLAQQANPFGDAPKTLHEANPFGEAPTNLHEGGKQLRTIAQKRKPKADPFGATPDDLFERPTAQGFMSAGKQAMSAELKQSLDKLTNSPEYKTYTQAKQQLVQVQTQIQQYRSQGKTVPGQLFTQSNQLQGTVNQLDRQVQRQIRETVPKMQAFRNSLLEKGDKKAAAEFAKSVPIDSKATRIKSAFRIRSDVEELHQLVGGVGVKQITYDGPRASANPETRSVNLGQDYKKSIVFHEMAHFIEVDNPAVGQAAVEWIQSRAAGQAQRMSKLTGNLNYRDNEIAYPDKFIDPYVGKLHTDSKGNIIPVTEVLSMGVERMTDAESMTRFYLQDPEHFLFTLGVMRGRK